MGARKKSKHLFPTPEATRRKLREAGFFLEKLTTADRDVLEAHHPEEVDYYLSAFLSAACAVPSALRKERPTGW